VSAVLLTANGFEMARLLGRDWIGRTYLVAACGHVGFSVKVRARYKQQEQKDGRFLLLHVLS